MAPALWFAWRPHNDKHVAVWNGSAAARQDVRTKPRALQGAAARCRNAIACFAVNSKTPNCRAVYHGPAPCRQDPPLQPPCSHIRRPTGAIRVHGMHAALPCCCRCAIGTYAFERLSLLRKQSFRKLSKMQEQRNDKAEARHEYKDTPSAVPHKM